MALLAPSSRLLPAANIGPDNPLPMLDPVGAATDRDDYGALASIYPYRLQDGYTRSRTDTELPTVVLENDRLRAELVPRLGGRLYSLVDKDSGRELLHCNTILQPANLALRDAWFAGGVEWNIGATGHTPLTCEPVFAARISDPELGTGARIYAWERIREVIYAIDFWLPDRSPVLLVHVAISNPHHHDVPMYWWSNIAVPQSDDLRVITPAHRAFRYGYRKGIGTVDIPVIDGKDVSRPVTATNSVDYFFDLEPGKRPWIAALDAAGEGLVHSSTARLFGRKLFCWGSGPGGRRWQEFLSGPGSAYCEIQAGLARTQLERIPMPAGSRWEWTETYGLLRTDAARSQGSDWDAAIAETGDRLDELVPPDLLDGWDRRATAAATRPIQELLVLGDGWAALEQRLRATAGQQPLPETATPWPEESLTQEQRSWLRLIDDGDLGSDRVLGYVAGSRWLTLLEKAPPTPESLLHQGILHWQDGNSTVAQALWVKAGDHPIALRCRALATADRGARADLLTAASDLSPDCLPLTRETLRALIDAGRGEEALRRADHVADPTGRCWLLKLEAALAAGELEIGESMLSDPPEIAGIREGELTLEQLWFRLHEHVAENGLGRGLTEAEREQLRRDHPIPTELDFRMAR